jgi:TolB-like protein
VIYRFDDFELDTQGFELRQSGRPRHVEPLVFDLLAFLARNAGRVIGRDEVVDQVWKGRVVSDATISSAVKSARKALGDSGDSQNYIRTVRGRGFQFAGKVLAAGRPAEGGSDEAAAALPRGRVAADKPVLVVLPFDNLSADVDAYFADGLTEDIITNLSRFRDLLVIARTTAFQFRNREVTLSAFCAELHAGYAVEGSVRRTPGRVRITAQLIDAASGVHLWADAYDREMADILAVQDEVTRIIAATLGVKLQDMALQCSLRKSPAELDAYDCVLRARRYTATLSPEMHAEARDLLERAVQLDPSSADAHALLANVYLAEHRFNANPRPDPIGRALAMAQTAIRLDPQSAYARCWLAIVHFFRHENDKFRAEAARALDLNPNDPETLADIGHFMAFMGDFERGVALSRQAQRLNPLHPGWYHFSLARHHFHRREYLATLAVLEEIAMPDFYWWNMLKAAAEGQLERPQAAASLASAYRLNPDLSPIDELRKWNAAPDDLEHLAEGLRKAGMKT